MAAHKTTIIKGKRKAIASRAKARRKLAVKQLDKTSETAKDKLKQKSENPPRRRNALGAIRVVNIVPLKEPAPENASKPQVFNIRKPAVVESRNDLDAPWDPAHLEAATLEETGHNISRMFKAMLVATLLLGLFNSGALVNWVRGLPAGPVEDRIILTAEVWHELMEDMGLSDYVIGVRKYVQSLKGRNW